MWEADNNYFSLIFSTSPPLHNPDRKKELLSRDDLQLPWRPLYNLYERVVYSKTEHLGLIWFPKYKTLFFFCIFVFFNLVDFPSTATILSCHPGSYSVSGDAAGKNIPMHLHPCKRFTFQETMVWMDVCVWAQFKAKQQLVLIVLPRRLPSKCDKKFCRQPLSKSGKLPFYGCHMSSKGAGRRISVS